MTHRGAKTGGMERLIEAAQMLLAETGVGSINSNAVAERAGVTPPTFYHYFPNKHALLRALGERMLNAQSAAIRSDTGRRVQTAADLRDICRDMLRESLRMSRAFTGGFELLVALRAIPDLRDVRLDHQERVAVLLVDYFAEQGLASDRDALMVRARLALHLGYAAVEMLFETDFANEPEVLDRTAAALAGTLDLF